MPAPDWSATIETCVARLSRHPNHHPRRSVDRILPTPTGQLTYPASRRAFPSPRAQVRRFPSRHQTGCLRSVSPWPSTGANWLHYGVQPDHGPVGVFGGAG